MRVVLFSTDPSGLDLLPALGSEHELVAVVVPSNRTDSDKVTQLVARAPCQTHVHDRGARLADSVPAADGAISWLYSQIIDGTDLARFHAGVLNMHGGILPDYRGANVLNWAIANGETEIGVTWHGLVKAVDAGPLYAESRVSVGADETAWDARARMIEEGLRLFPRAWHRLVDGKSPVRLPDLDQGRVWPSRRPRHGRIESGWSAARLRNLIRAQCPPWPPATIERDGADVPVRALAKRPGPGRMAYQTSDGETTYLELEPGAPC